jgi:hypothetical protein
MLSVLNKYTSVLWVIRVQAVVLPFPSRLCQLPDTFGKVVPIR